MGNVDRSVARVCIEYWIQSAASYTFPNTLKITFESFRNDVIIIHIQAHEKKKTHTFSPFFIVIMLFAIFQKLSDWLMAFFFEQSTFNFRFNVLIKIQSLNGWILSESVCVHVSCLPNAERKTPKKTDEWSSTVYGFEFNVISNFFFQSIFHLMQQVNCRNSEGRKKKNLTWCVTGYEQWAY